ncbi:MAG TPA: GntR family transcriptional regulator [Terriglobales bacterium]|nr:GntR family transcriptional regulator [Terriglobales bacterium]
MLRTRQNGIPAYKRIQAVILKRIESGQLKPGDEVSSERELARIHKVSLMTARHALAELEKEGLVERRRGAGTFVAPPKIHFNKLMSYTELMAGRSLPARSKVLSLQVIDDEQEIAARLALANGGRLLRLERVRQGADEPFALETCYMSAETFEGLNRNALERGSLFMIVENEFGVELAYADEEIDATAADSRLAKLFSIEKGAPLLRVRQVIYSGKGTPIIYMLGLYRSDRHNLTIRRYRRKN